MLITVQQPDFLEKLGFFPALRCTSALRTCPRTKPLFCRLSLRERALFRGAKGDIVRERVLRFSPAEEDGKSRVDGAGTRPSPTDGSRTEELFHLVLIGLHDVLDTANLRGLAGQGGQIVSRQV